MRKANAARHRPIEHRRDHRAQLAEEGDFSRRRCQMRKGGVEPNSGHHDADAVRADDAQRMGSCRIQCGLLQGVAALAKLGETGRNHHGRASRVPPAR